MPRPGSEWSIAAQPSESIPDEVPQQTTPSKILRNPAAPQSVPQAVPSLQQQQHVQHHRGAFCASVQHQRTWSADPIGH